MRLDPRCSLRLAVIGCAASIACAGQPPERIARPVAENIAKPIAASTTLPPRPKSAESDSQAFSDPTFAYSMHLPRDWRPVTNLAEGKVVRLSMVTPAGDRFIVTVDRLPERVTRASKFEEVGEQYVTPIVERFMRVFKLMDGARKTDDRSKADSLRFWEGTSTFGPEVGPTMLLSLHAIRFDSDVMVNLVYVSTHNSTDDVQAVDRIMDSLSFE
jgi:hypothetical protein